MFGEGGDADHAVQTTVHPSRLTGEMVVDGAAWRHVEHFMHQHFGIGNPDLLREPEGARSIHTSAPDPQHRYQDLLTWRINAAVFMHYI